MAFELASQIGIFGPLPTLVHSAAKDRSEPTLTDAALRLNGRYGRSAFTIKAGLRVASVRKNASQFFALVICGS